MMLARAITITLAVCAVLQTALAIETGSRPARGTLSAPQSSTLLADFTDGTHVLGPTTGTGNDLMFGTQSSVTTAGVCTYSLTADGLLIELAAGQTSGYCQVAWEPARTSPGTTIDLTDGHGSGNDFVAWEIDLPEGLANCALGTTISFSTLPGNAYGTALAQGQVSALGACTARPTRKVEVIRTSVDAFTLTGGGPAGWPAKMTAVNKIDFRLNMNVAAVNNYPARVTIRKLWKGRGARVVLISYDDAHREQYTLAEPILTAAGMAATIFPSAFYATDGVNRLSVADQQALRAAGWAIGYQQYHDANKPQVAVATSGSGLTCSGGVATWTDTEPNAMLGFPVGRKFPIVGTLDPAWQATERTVLSSDTVTGVMTFACGAEQTPAIGSYISALGYSAADVQKDATDSAAVMESRGIGWTREYAAWSQGRWNNAYLDAMAGAGVRFARTTQTGSAPMTRAFDTRLLGTVRGSLQITTGNMDQQNETTILGWVDGAEARSASNSLYNDDLQAGCSGSCPVLTMDSVDFSEVVNGTATLKGLLKREQQGLLEVVTYEELKARR